MKGRQGRCRAVRIRIIRRRLSGTRYRPSISAGIWRARLPCQFGGRSVIEPPALSGVAVMIRLDRPKPFLAFKPLHGSLRHTALLSGACLMAMQWGGGDY